MRQWLVAGYLDANLLVGSNLAPTYLHQGATVQDAPAPDPTDPEAFVPLSALYDVTDPHSCFRNGSDGYGLTQEEWYDPERQAANAAVAAAAAAEHEAAEVAEAEALAAAAVAAEAAAVAAAEAEGVAAESAAAAAAAAAAGDEVAAEDGAGAAHAGGDEGGEEAAGEEDADYAWYYWDNSGVEQGPFPSADMIAWLEGGFLADDLYVRTAQEEGYHWTVAERFPDKNMAFMYA